MKIREIWSHRLKLFQCWGTFACEFDGKNGNLRPMWGPKYAVILLAWYGTAVALFVTAIAYTRLAYPDVPMMELFPRGYSSTMTDNIASMAYVINLNVLMYIMIGDNFKISRELPRLWDFLDNQAFVSSEGDIQRTLSKRYYVWSIRYLTNPEMTESAHTVLDITNVVVIAISLFPEVPGSIPERDKKRRLL